MTQNNNTSDKVVAVIVAAGRSTRMAGLDKQFALVEGRPLLFHTVEVFEASPLISEYVIVLNEDNLMRGRALAYEMGLQKLKRIVPGGSRRQDSVWAGLQAFEANPPGWVMIHDGARPFITPQILTDGLAAAQEHGAAVAAVPVKDTIKLVDETGLVASTPARDLLWAIQTPQIFSYSAICEAHRQAIVRNLDVTDDAMLLELMGQPVKVYRASYNNFKVTTPEDLVIARQLFTLESQEQKPETTAVTETVSDKTLPEIRMGQGYDVHRLAKGRKLILGGVEVPFELGLDGHSDADVLTHVIINALLGAAGLGDIGRYFPPTDPIYKDISSLKMLEHVRNLLYERNWQILNIDATVAAQRPKLASYIPSMREALAQVLQIEATLINVKATTTEELGFVGRMEGMEGQAVALLRKR
jgi:2-C-methyl-D-erythritol 4-phosphate cytidylyltransferase/2-C-methyl-D-erythritol 2,4-cyclodiphosphate synthase